MVTWTRLELAAIRTMKNKGVRRCSNSIYQGLRSKNVSFKICLLLGRHHEATDLVWMQSCHFSLYTCQGSGIRWCVKRERVNMWYRKRRPLICYLSWHKCLCNLFHSSSWRIMMRFMAALSTLRVVCCCVTHPPVCHSVLVPSTLRTRRVGYLTSIRPLEKQLIEVQWFVQALAMTKTF